MDEVAGLVEQPPYKALLTQVRNRSLPGRSQRALQDPLNIWQREQGRNKRYLLPFIRGMGDV